MSVAKVTEVTATSPTSIEDAISHGIDRANKTLENISGVWVNEIKCNVADGKVTNYRVNMKVTFVLND